MSRVRLAAVALACLLLAGCLSLAGPRNEVRVFSPDTKVQPDPEWPQADWQMMVMAVSANQLLDSPRIAVRPVPNQLQTYRGVRWADNAPELLETAIVEGFEDSGRIAAIGRMGNSARGDFALFLEVRAFETVYRDGQPEAVIEVQVSMVHLRAGRVASKRFRQVVPGAAEDIDSMVVAFGEAMSATATDVVGWALVEGNRARAAIAAESAGK